MKYYFSEVGSNFSILNLIVKLQIVVKFTINAFKYYLILVSVMYMLLIRLE